MTVATPLGPLTVTEYLVMERAATEKHVLWDGAVFAMAGASPRHNFLVAALLGALGRGLAGKPCKPFASDQRVRLPRTARYVYPDATVFCPPFELDPDDEMTLQNPRLVAEVLSTSTEAFDRGEKAIAYRTIPSLDDYLLLSQDVPRVEHYARESGDVWRLVTLGADDRLTIPSVGLDVAVAELYAGFE